MVGQGQGLQNDQGCAGFFNAFERSVSYLFKIWGVVRLVQIRWMSQIIFYISDATHNIA